MSAKSGKTILIADDEQDLLNLVSSNFNAAGFDVVTVEDGESALEVARSARPALIVLDLMLPGMSGLDVCRALKADIATRAIPIVMLTARASEVDRIVGLELGADDYVTKPFSTRELVLRVHSILRRATHTPGTNEVLTAGDIQLDRARHAVLIKNKPIDLTAIEFKLLSVLMERSGRVQSRETLLKDVWGYESEIDSRTVDTHIRRLRDKLGQSGEHIETIRGFGYRALER